MGVKYKCTQHSATVNRLRPAALALPLCEIKKYIVFMRESINDESINERFSKIESDIIRQENSVTSIVKNIYKYGLQSNDKAKTISVWTSVFNYFLKRQVLTIVVAFTSGIIAIIGCVLAYQANNMLNQQNELLEIQNDRIIDQTYLQEAERRSGLVYLFSNVMDILDDELKNDYENDGIRNLSPQCVGRVISLAQRLKPYRYYNNGALIDYEISPERGQLLNILLESKLDEETLDRILDNGNFTYSELDNISFIDLNKNSFDLSNTRTNKIHIQNCIFDWMIMDKSYWKNIFTIRLKIDISEITDSELNFTVLDSFNINFSTIYESKISAESITGEMNNPVWFEDNTIEYSNISLSFDSIRFKNNFIINTYLNMETKLLDIHSSYFIITDSNSKERIFMQE